MAACPRLALILLRRLAPVSVAHPHLRLEVPDAFATGEDHGQPFVYDFEADPSYSLNARFTDGLDSCVLEVAPEGDGGWVFFSPCFTYRDNRIVTMASATIEFEPGAQRTLVSERQLTCLAVLPLVWM